VVDAQSTLTGGASLAASWDREPARRVGERLGRDARAFSYWDSTAHKWTIDPGKFVIRAGVSSENTPLLADLTLNYRGTRVDVSRNQSIQVDATIRERRP